MNPIFSYFRNIINTGRNSLSKELAKGVTEADLKLAEEINMLSDDVEKILEFEHIKGQHKSFVIVNKTKSQAEVYRNGKPIDRFEVGVGATVGDDLNTTIYKFGSFLEEGRTTPSGHFLTEPPYSQDLLNKREYESGECINLLLLKGVQHPADFKYRTCLALHQVPQSHPERIELLSKTDGKRRGVSSGCVNFKPEEFYRLAGEIRPSRTNVYILPEDEGNKLELISLPNGLWFKTKYKDPEKENIFVQAMKQLFKLD